MSSTGTGSDRLHVHLLGLVDFDTALILQQRLVLELGGRNDRHGALLLCEHPPLVTIGREGSRGHLQDREREWIARSLPRRWLNRGGGCWVHLPGQLAIYPVVPPRRLGFGLREYRSRLASALEATCEEVGHSTRETDHASGIFTRDGQVGMLGIAVKDWIAYHGAVLNVGGDVEPFSLIETNPFGQKVTSLSIHQTRTPSMPAVRTHVIQHLTESLGYTEWDIFTGHPLLTRAKTI